MKYGLRTTLALALASVATGAFASDAETAARAARNGAAGATATHNGTLGFSRTDARTGEINLARGVAVGVDREGVSLSLSHALAPRVGPALGGSFNMTIDRDGDVSHSRSLVIGEGGPNREVSVGGNTGVHRGRHTATAHGTGHADRVRSHATAHTPRDRRPEVQVYRPGPHGRYHARPQPARSAPVVRTVPAGYPRHVTGAAAPHTTGRVVYRGPARPAVHRAPARAGGYERINGRTYRVIRR